MPLRLDRTDRKILKAMQLNGRISNLELAELVGLSPTPCSRRVKRLEESGLIRNWGRTSPPAGSASLSLTSAPEPSIARL